MRVAWKKKNEKNEIVCFYCTQSDIFLCGIASFSRGNKNKLRRFQSQKWKKIKNSQPQTKFTGSYKTKRVHRGYKNFDNQVFQKELNSELFKIDLNNAELSEFTENFQSILDKWQACSKKSQIHEQITLIS